MEKRLVPLGRAAFDTLETMASYEVRKSTRAKHMRITVRKEGMVTITIPHRMSIARGERFAEDNMAWIMRTVEKMRTMPQPFSYIPKANDKDFAIYKGQACMIAKEKIQRWNTLYGFAWNRITIRNTRSRWGSCSKKKNLSFSYRLALLPEELQDYLIVHELCHLGAFDHSPNFWKLVERAIPDYKLRRKQLKSIQ